MVEDRKEGREGVDEGKRSLRTPGSLIVNGCC